MKARQTTARQLLDIGARKIGKGLNDAPDAKLRMLDILGSLYLDLGLDDQAVLLQKQRVAVAKSRYPKNDPAIAAALIDLAESLHASRSVNEREAVLLEAKSILDNNGDFASQRRGTLLYVLAEHYGSSDMPKSLAFAKESVEVYRKWPPSREMGVAFYQLALAYNRRAQYAELAAAAAEAISLSKKFEGDPNPNLARYYAYQAEAEYSLLRYGAAEQSYRLAVKYARTLGDDEDIEVLSTESLLGAFLVSTSRPREGLLYLEKALNSCLHARGPEDPFYTPQMLIQYGMALEAMGRPEDALRYISQAVENRRKNRPGTRYLGQMLEDQALLFVELARYQQADQLLKEALVIRKQVGAEMDRGYLAPAIMLSLSLRKPEGAQELVDRYLGPEPKTAGAGTDFLKNLWARAAISLEKGDGNSAIAQAGRMAEMITASSVRSYLEIWYVRALLAQGEGYLLTDQATKAQPLLKRALQGATNILDANSPDLAVVEAKLGASYLDLGDRKSARSLLSKARSILGSHKERSELYSHPARDLANRLAARSQFLQ